MLVEYRGYSREKAIQFYARKSTFYWVFYYVDKKENILYTFEHYNPHKVRIVFKGNVTDKCSSV
jgi:hypothetical protein